MSAAATAWAWSVQFNLASTKLVLLCLADSHDANSGRIDANVEHICSATGVSQKTARAALAKLEDAGYIAPTRLTVSEAGFSLAGSPSGPPVWIGPCVAGGEHKAAEK